MKEIAIEIINIFTSLLADKNIMIPSDDREGEPDESPIYGTEYYDLEDDIIAILIKNFGDKKEDY